MGAARACWQVLCIDKDVMQFVMLTLAAFGCCRIAQLHEST